MSLLGIPNKSSILSPVTEKENALLSLVPGSPVKNVALNGVSQVARGSGCSPGSGSPMFIGSPAGMTLGVALKIRVRAPTPTKES